jgi:serine/threonine protein kinase
MVGTAAAPRQSDIRAQVRDRAIHPSYICSRYRVHAMQTTDSELIGTVIGRYRVMTSLGTGTMGHVYDGEHVETGARVALKVLHPHHQGSEAAARSLREGKTLGLFHHPNIVELLEVGQGDDGSMFLATEIVPGVSLRELLNGGRVDSRRALTIIDQVLDALGTAHALGVVHRDVKPENVMLADDDNVEGREVVKVLDFGVAKLLGDTPKVLGEANLTQVGLSVFGSPDYISPESALGNPIDGRSDLYSVGAMLFELLTGKPPFEASEPQEILRLNIVAPIPTLASRASGRTFTPELEGLVAEALAKEPDQRFRSAAEMRTALQGALRSIDAPPLSALQPTIMTPSIPAPDPVPRTAPPVTSHVVRGHRRDRALAWARSHRIALAAGGAALLGLVVLAIAVGGSKPSREHARNAADPASLVALGHQRFAAGKRVDALAYYERALRLSSNVATDDEVRQNLAKALEGKDTVAAVIALELLASQMSPPLREPIIEAASAGKQLDVRHRAFAIAERDGFETKIDRVASWSLDLQQATSCDDRRVAIDKLASASDKRAVAAIKRARAFKCVEKAADDAIARLESGT